MKNAVQGMGDEGARCEGGAARGVIGGVMLGQEGRGARPGWEVAFGLSVTSAWKNGGLHGALCCCCHASGRGLAALAPRYACLLPTAGWRDGPAACTGKSRRTSGMP